MSLAHAAPTPPPSVSRGHARLRGLAAALFGAACVHVAIPTLNLAFTALVAWVPALVLARDLRWARRLRLGWLIGFGADLLTFAFIAFTMEQMTNLPAVAGVGLVIAYAGWHGLLGGVFLALAEPARRAAEARLPGSGPLAVAFTYAAVDWLWPQVFPLSIGHSFWQVGPVMSLAALTGVPGLAFLTLLVNASLADLWRHRRPRRLVAPALVAVALLGFGAAWYLHLHAVTPTRTLRVAILQPNFSLEEKRRAAGRGAPGVSVRQRAQFLARLDARLRALPAGRYDLVVGPEGVFPYFWRVDADRFTAGEPMPHDVTPTRQIARAVAEGPRTDVILGGLRKGPDGRTRNAAVHIGGDGTLRGYYDKQTLMPFGETLPGRDLFPELAAKIQGIADFQAGDAACSFAVGGVGVGCGICYESVFAAATRADLGSAALLVNLTIDTWFGTTNAPESHLMLQAARAVELGVPLVRAALTGISAVVTADGQVSAALPLDVDDVLSVDVPLVPVSTPYRAIGPAFAWLAFAVMVLALALAWRRRRELFPAAAVPGTVRRVGEAPSVGDSAAAAAPGHTADITAEPGTGPSAAEGASQPGEARKQP